MIFKNSYNPISIKAYNYWFKDNKPPRFPAHLKTKCKRAQIQIEKTEKILHENRSMLQKLLKIDSHNSDLHPKKLK